MRDHIAEIAIVAWTITIILTILFVMGADVPDGTELP